MRKTTFCYQPFLLLLLFSVLFVACEPKPPVITFVPSSGMVGDTIEIKIETNLIVEKIAYEIKFGTVSASVLSLANNIARVVVPKEAITSKIGLTIGPKTFTSDSTFTVLHIYVGGNVNRTPTYWKDGQATAASDGAAAGTSMDMAVLDGKVYMCGYKALTNSTSIAKYWIDGQPTNLTDGTTEARASGIWIEGKDVYIAGNETTKKGSDKITQPKYWKNGTPVLLTVSEGEAYAQSISVVNADVYVSGYVSLGNFGYPMYWKNGKEVVFKDIIGGVAFPTSLTASGPDVYLMAVERKPLEVNQALDYFNLVYWKNNQKTTVPSSSPEVKSILNQSDLLISGKDLYFIANQYDKDLKILAATYWKNDQEIKIGDAKADIASSIALSNDDVYLAGYSTNSVKYWKNGVATLLVKDTEYPTANQLVIAP